MPNIYNFFKFLEKKKGTKTPIEAKLLYAPEEITDEDLNVEGYLDLSHTSITSLPNNLKVGGYLTLTNLKITSLPDNLKVGGNLILSHSKISSIPNNLKVGRSLYLRNTPLEVLYSEKEIRNMIEKKGGYVKGEIYGVD